MVIKTSLIVTTLNEENTIEVLLLSILRQSLLPDEVIFVDGGSDDTTVNILKKHIQIFTKSKSKLQVSIKKGNRSVGRNEAVRNASNDIILCTDAGNVLDTNWVKNIVQPFKDNNIVVVAGYYRGIANSVFEKCLIPYVLVMEDRVDSQSFLPATRSMAFRKTIWKKVGGFPEEFSHNEDFVFARELQKLEVPIAFVKNATVAWYPRNTAKQAFNMFYRFAYGDIESGIVRRKVQFIFFRYIVGLSFFFVGLIIQSFFIIIVCSVLLGLYLLWAIMKNYKYVKDVRAIFVLPFLQLLSDLAVLTGSTMAFLRKR